MATFDDVREIAIALPGVSERTTRGHIGWWAGGSLFVWERPLGARDREALGAAAPAGPVLGVRVADEGEKAALLGGESATYFTIPHFDGYPAILVLLDAVSPEELEARVVEAWCCRAPARPVKAFLASGAGEDQ